MSTKQTFIQYRLVFENGICYYKGEVAVAVTEPDDATIEFCKKNNLEIIDEETFLERGSRDGYTLQSANYCVLGSQEIHYFLFAATYESYLG